MKTCCVGLNFGSVDEMLWCNHSNESLWHYFPLVLFVLHYLTKEDLLFLILIFGTFESLRVNFLLDFF